MLTKTLLCVTSFIPLPDKLAILVFVRGSIILLCFNKDKEVN